MPTKEEQLVALSATVRRFIDHEIPTAAQWNVDPDIITAAAVLIGSFFTDTDSTVAALQTVVSAIESATIGEWVTEVAAPHQINTSQFYLAGDRRADYTIAQRLRLRLGASFIVVVIQAVSFDSVNTIITVSPASLTGALNRVDYGLVRFSAPQIQIADLFFDPATQPELDAAVAGLLGALATAISGVLSLAGGQTMTGRFTLSGDPTAALHPGSKQYIDARAVFSAVATGTDTYTATLPTIAQGPAYVVLFTNANTVTGPTLNTKTIVGRDGSALGVGDIVAGSVHVLSYDGGNLRLVTQPTGGRTVLAGSSGTAMRLSGTLNSQIGPIASVAPGPTTLFTYNLPANLLDANAKWVRVTASWKFAGPDSGPSVTLKFGSTTIVTGSTSTGGGTSGMAIVEIVRSGPSSQMVSGGILGRPRDGAGGALGKALDTAAEDTTHAIAVSLLGTGSNNGDVTGLTFKVEAEA